MLEGTEREVLELLLERPCSPTEVADELGVSVQTASRNLKRLVEREFAERTRDGGGRGYKRYRAREFAQVFAGYDGELLERVLPLSDEKRTVLSVWKIPQPKFQPILLSYLYTTPETEFGGEIDVIIVYGSVARGEAKSDSDIDLLVVRDDSAVDDVRNTTVNWQPGRIESRESGRVISEIQYPTSEFHDALDAGSRFLRNVLDEGIVLYDPKGVIRDAKRERAGERVPQ
jgi:DNA-binding transcriptional ArsR family regulator